MEKFKGVFPVALTPFKAGDQSVDFARLEKHIDFLLESGIHGLCANGSTSEFPMLTDEEALKVAKTILHRVNGKVPVIVGASAPSTRKTLDFCKMAEDIGAAGLLMLPPYYFPLDNLEIYKHYEIVASKTRLPIMIYNNPHTSKLDLQPELVAKLAEMDRIQYIKESSGVAARIHEIRSLAGDKIDIFIGSDNIFFDALVSGATGVIASSGNVIPSQMVEIYRLIKEEKDIDKARERFDRISPLVSFIDGSPNFVQVLKTALEIMGKPMGVPRYPLLTLSGEKREKLGKILKSIGLA
jgi:4-hydroxy-tetrahydrodipicolinate synthase